MVHLLADLAHEGRALNRRALPALAVAAALAVPALAGPRKEAEPPSRPRVLSASYAGIISPVAGEYITDAVERANREGFDALVLRLDTPGGLDASMREAVKAILASRVPVIVYVAPSGARAASAGVFITMAAHVAAMAPGTNIGAAHPVMLGPGAAGGGKEEKPDSTMMEKLSHDAAAYLKALARQRGRNEAWAEEAVTKSTSTPAEEAVREGVVDFVAEDMDDLLAKADGRDIPELKLKLRVKEAVLTPLEMTDRQKALAVLSDPNIAMILMSLGAAGLFIELYHPGLVFPGVAGAICLLLAFYAFQTLSANIAGVLLILVGFLLFLLEIKLMSFGLLTAGGLLAVMLGVLMLFNVSGAWGVAVSMSVVGWTLGAFVAFTGTLSYLYYKTQRRRPATGREGLLGAEGEAKTDLAPLGTVEVMGELWKAKSAHGEIPAGTPIEVVKADGFTLLVRKRAA